MLTYAARFTDYVLAFHILGVVIAFGATFAYPVIFASARRADPSVMPWLFSVMQRIDRFIVNPGLTLVLVAGIVLASKFHLWSEFFVQWGLAAVVVIGAGCAGRAWRLAVESRVRQAPAAGVDRGSGARPDRDRDDLRDGHTPLMRISHARWARTHAATSGARR